MHFNFCLSLKFQRIILSFFIRNISKYQFLEINIYLFLQKYRIEEGLSMQTETSAKENRRFKRPIASVFICILMMSNTKEIERTTEILSILKWSEIFIFSQLIFKLDYYFLFLFSFD